MCSNESGMDSSKTRMPGIIPPTRAVGRPMREAPGRPQSRGRSGNDRTRYEAVLGRPGSAACRRRLLDECPEKIRFGENPDEPVAVGDRKAADLVI